MEITCHPLFRDFMLHAEIIAGRRLKVSGALPMQLEEVQAECDKILAATPTLASLELYVENEYSAAYYAGPHYFFCYQGHDEKMRSCTEGSDEPSLALAELVKNLKHRGLISYTLPFPEPVVEEFRDEPSTRDERKKVDRELDTIAYDFKRELEAAVDSIPTPEGRAELVGAALNDFDSLEWIPGNHIGELVEQTIEDVRQFVSKLYEKLIDEVDTLSGVLGDKSKHRKILSQGLQESNAAHTNTPKGNVKETKQNAKSSKAKHAQLKGIDLTQVRKLFEGAKLSGKSKAGEWATALVALSSRGLLIGSPPEVIRWFDANDFPGTTSRETLDDLKDFTDTNQFTGSKALVFRRMLSQIEAIKRYN
ncbi:hypothetical protein [Hymenobacter glacieicola]|uniref:Uncharacterized protein n=1 Tax=Hymenobacter glacieicola TaxID=1562124 RepID=A0ABQ1WH37_9BACT|nr:hypothetical protein [Hymenobacter glacieicola]GGG29192.1 hypothetical protein GCM10011378_02340 [Hymenobacter glacieicola]